MDEKKCGFLLYEEYEELLAMLTDEECGRLFRGIFYYERTGEEPDGMSQGMKIIFTVIRNRLDANREKYRKKCERMRENGMKGGRPKADGSTENQNKPNESNCFSEKPNESKENQAEAKKPDTVTDTVTVTDTDTDNKKDIIYLSPSERARERKNGKGTRAQKQHSGSFDTEDVLLSALRRTYGGNV
jgi:hypothetical protein